MASGILGVTIVAPGNKTRMMSLAWQLRRNCYRYSYSYRYRYQEERAVEEMAMMTNLHTENKLDLCGVHEEGAGGRHHDGVYHYILHSIGSDGSRDLLRIMRGRCVGCRYMSE